MTNILSFHPMPGKRLKSMTFDSLADLYKAIDFVIDRPVNFNGLAYGTSIMSEHYSLRIRFEMTNEATMRLTELGAIMDSQGLFSLDEIKRIAYMMYVMKIGSDNV